MTIISRRLKVCARGRGAHPAATSDQLGFKDRQTVAAIEAGKPQGLGGRAHRDDAHPREGPRLLHRPYRLDGEAVVVVRVRRRPGAHDFELRAGRWLALYRSLAQDEEGNAPRTSPLGLSLTARSSYEDAHRAANWLREEWQLGDRPAEKLEDGIRDRLRALVLHVDAPQGISGAAFRLPEFNASW
jgi:hypothetical protein